ncbi:MAG TPA: glycosyltransferase family 39 protein [Candidatus Binatia bacterium]|nr:glycosyltransferase family 39 protein [Candidatus Binatia bacterium]
MRTAPQRAALVGAVIAAIVTLPGLGIGTLWDNSETAYGEVAREVLLYHDAVVLHFNGAPWFIQPPLYFWLAALSAKLLGAGTLAMRLPSALATIALAALTGYATCRVAGLRTACYATLILSTSVMQAIVGRLAIMDALLDLCVAAAIFGFFGSLQPEDWRLSIERRRTAAWYWAWVAMAFGVLAKGPVAVVIPAMVIVAWILWEARDGRVLAFPGWRAWLGALLLFVAITAPWFALLQSRVGGVGIAELLWHYSFGRYVGTIEGQAGPVWYYLPALILGFFPWIAFLPAAFGRAVRDALNDRDAALVRLALLWAVLPFLFFSFAQTKLPNYIALELPALAILVALWFERVSLGEERRAAIVSGLVVPVALGVVAGAVVSFSSHMQFTDALAAIARDVRVLGIVMGAGALIAFLLLLRVSWAVRAPYALAAATVTSLLLIALVVEPQVEPFKPMPQIAAIIERERRPGDAVVIQSVAGANALLFYTEPKIEMLPPPDDPQHALCSAPRVFYVAPRDGATPEPSNGRTRRLITVSGKDGLFLYEGTPCVTF